MEIPIYLWEIIILLSITQQVYNIFFKKKEKGGQLAVKNLKYIQIEILKIFLKIIQHYVINLKFTFRWWLVIFR